MFAVLDHPASLPVLARLEDGARHGSTLMELCEYLGPIPPPGILLHELVVAGLVTTSDASDITSAWYELTEAGRTALAGARANGFWECKTSVQEPRKPKSS